MSEPKPMTWRVDLTDDEMLRLDGLCRPDVQAVVEQVKLATSIGDKLTPGQAAIVAKAVAEARETGRLRYVRTAARYCTGCGKSGGYATYRSGSRRGLPNFDRPVTFWGIDMSSSFVRVQNHLSVGACLDCMAEMLPVLVAALADVPAEVPDVLRAEGAPRRKRWSLATCTECGWSGHEGQMRPLRTLLGDGTYQGGCPQCPAENGPGRRPIEIDSEGFVVVEVDEAVMS